MDSGKTKTNLFERNPYECSDLKLLQDWVFLLQEIGRKDAQITKLELDIRFTLKGQIELLKERIKDLSFQLDKAIIARTNHALIVNQYRELINNIMLKAVSFEGRSN